MQRGACMTCNPFVKLRMAFRLSGLLLVLVSPLAGAEDADPPCADEAYRAFDFWLGEWEVHIADGRRAGHNVITAAEDGCLIHEQWTSVSGGQGFSMNFYDPADAAWRQVWVSADGIIDISGGLESGAMVLTGTILYRETAITLPFRGRWELLPDGRVRQFFEEQRENTWEPWFEGFYTKAVE
jgi:hypothetical protein